MIAVYIILGIVALFFLLQFFMVFRMKMKKGKPAPDLEGKAGRALKSGKKALFYFYSPGCRACHAMTPVVQRLAGKRKNVFPVNIADDMETARKFGVMGTPSTVLVEGGVIREFIVGPRPEADVVSLIS